MICQEKYSDFHITASDSATELSIGSDLSASDYHQSGKRYFNKMSDHGAFNTLKMAEFGQYMLKESKL